MIHRLKMWPVHKRKPFVAGCFAVVAIVSVYLVLDCYFVKGVDPVDDAEWTGRMAERDSITFRSWGGRWIGTDCDTDLTFFPNGKVEMIEYGDGVEHYQGTYSVDSSGSFFVRFRDLGDDWPIMMLDRDSVSLRLRPKHGIGFFTRNRGGATIVAGKGSYWPFRPLTADAEPKDGE